MIKVRKGKDRGAFNYGWLDTRHTFSFGQYHDRNHMAYRSLRVINEDYVAPGVGFEPHPHRDMEIITYVVKGALKHEDNISSPDEPGHSLVLRPGEVQRISAGTGIVHSEVNPSEDEPVHLLQIWIMPDRRGHKPGYEQRAFKVAEEPDRLHLVASRDGRAGSIPVNQDADLYAGVLSAGGSVSHAMRPGRGAWVQVVKGEVDVNGVMLEAGDGASVENEEAVRLSSEKGTEVLVFDLM